MKKFLTVKNVLIAALALGFVLCVWLAPGTPRGGRSGSAINYADIENRDDSWLTLTGAEVLFGWQAASVAVRFDALIETRAEPVGATLFIDGEEYKSGSSTMAYDENGMFTGGEFRFSVRPESIAFEGAELVFDAHSVDDRQQSPSTEGFQMW